MSLSENTKRVMLLSDKSFLPVAAAALIYQGAAVGENDAGYARPLAAGDAFCGFSEAEADNTNGAAGDKDVYLYERGRVELEVVGAAITSNDHPAVYASDDGTFTLTAGGNTLIGYVSRHIDGTTCLVNFDVALVKAALQV